MLNLDSLMLECFLKENREFFEGARVQKIQQPTRKELILHLRNNRETKKLYININPLFFHLAFMSLENEKKRSLLIPKQPPMFCMLLRKHMEGAKITKVHKPENERIFEIFFENYNEIGSKIQECLSIELMGKHSNIVLYDADTNIIIGCAHNIGAQKSKERELAGSLPYIYPPKQNKRNLLTTRLQTFLKLLSSSNEPLKKNLSSVFFNLSQVLAEDILRTLNIEQDTLSKDLSQQNAVVLYETLFEFLKNPLCLYSVSADFEKFSPVLNLEYKYKSINQMIDDYYSHHLEIFNLKNAKNKLEDILEKDLKKLNKSLQIQEKLLENKNKAQTYKLKADLIKTNMYLIEKNCEKVVLNAFDSDEEMLITLDPSISLIENANKYYEKYNKAKRTFCAASELYSKLQQEIEIKQELLFSVQIAKNLRELEETAQEILPETKEKKEEQSTVQTFEINGKTVYLGKNNKQNDLIYSKLSSPDDLWFHALNVPGAHVLVKINGKNPLDLDTLTKAAKLAKEFSTAKTELKAPVIYTKRKYLKKPPNQKGGKVTYKNETQIIID